MRPAWAARAAILPTGINLSNTLPSEVNAPAPPPKEDREGAQEGPIPFEDSVSDVFLARFSRYQPPNIAIEPLVEIARGLWHPMDIWSTSQYDTYVQIEQLSSRREITGTYFSIMRIGSHFRTWFGTGWHYTHCAALFCPNESVCRHPGLECLILLGKVWVWVLLFNFRRDTCQGYIILEYFTKLTPSFIPYKYVNAMQLASNIPQCSLTDVYSSVWDNFNRKEALYAKKAKEVRKSDQ